MNEILRPREAVAKLNTYDPGHYEVDIDLSANENPYDLPADLKARITSAALEIPFNRYPDPLALELRAAIAAYHGLKTANVAIGNGGDELLMAILLAFGGPGRTAVTFEPTFVMYAILAALTGTDCLKFARDKQFALPGEARENIGSAADIVFVCSPNNPTGNLATEAEVVALLDGGFLVVVDEAYGEFSGVSAAGLLRSYSNLAVLKTFSKAFSLAGLRVGYLLGAPEIVADILKVKLPYNVNAFSQAAATALMENRRRFDGIIDEIRAERQRLFDAICGIDGLTPYFSRANFILVKSAVPAGDLWRNLLERSILVRYFERTPGLEDCLRITIGKPAENNAVIAALRELSEK
ncbi:MAG: histidinol-phosphate transaminase [Actinomycetota bacterium]|nr:histidinol-phosphate transaminase [Actinomycetota bacterium]